MFTDFERDKDVGVGVMFEDFITAVGMMVYTNERTVTVSDLALAFNTTHALVREAVAGHPWLHMNDHADPAQQVVESDGE
jgi:hypothetical protein